MRENKVIALTFDDGPNTTVTPLVLDILEKYGITASFFLIGNNIDESSAESLTRAYNMGCEIDSHSLTHSDMTKLTAEQIKDEMDVTAKRIFDVIGEYPKFFRPPYIAYNKLMFDIIDMPFICGRGVDDWDNNVSAEQRINGVLEGAKDGQVILLHDSDSNYKTVEAIDKIIPELLDRGYRFVTVSELFMAKGIVPKRNADIVYTYADQTEPFAQ